MSQTVHLQKLHFQEMEMVFLWMWLVNRMLPSSVTVRCEGEVLKLPIKRLSRVCMQEQVCMVYHVAQFACLESRAISRGMGPTCSPEWQNCPMPFAVVLYRSQHEVTAILYLSGAKDIAAGCAWRTIPVLSARWRPFSNCR